MNTQKDPVYIAYVRIPGRDISFRYLAEKKSKQ